jgi:tetratricopeptide (TPR) repeat protein
MGGSRGIAGGVLRSVPPRNPVCPRSPRWLSRVRLTAGILLSWALTLAGCSRAAEGDPAAGQPRPVPKAVAAAAEGHSSDAAFAVQIRDFARAATSLTEALKLRDDVPEWWASLGSVNRRLNKTNEARSAYRKALAIHEARYSKTRDPDEIMARIYLLIVLDREKDARELLATGRKTHPNDEQLLKFDQNKGVDLLLTDPAVKENRL